jgi:hypothetical protein
MRLTMLVRSAHAGVLISGDLLRQIMSCGFTLAVSLESQIPRLEGGGTKPKPAADVLEKLTAVQGVSMIQHVHASSEIKAPYQEYSRPRRMHEYTASEHGVQIKNACWQGSGCVTESAAGFI